MSSIHNISQAVQDFHQARRKADLQAVFARISGDSKKLFSYEEVRQKLRAIEGNTKKLEDIPLDAIVGSVGRYTDFSRDFLPLHDSDQDRWTKIMVKALGSTGLPPIEVYRIGEVYFVIDGNHRISVARQLGASHIQGYVTEVRSRVPLTKKVEPDQLIIIAEHLSFIEQTQIDKLRPKSNLMVTNPGQYPILEEHISVHRYFMGLEHQREIPYAEAVANWYDQVYLPVVQIIREGGILKNFPERTETDLYLWISKHQGKLKAELGWEIEPKAVADDLVFTFGPDLVETISRFTERIIDVVIPDSLETGPEVGHWRQKYAEPKQSERLFENLLVAIGPDSHNWQAFSQALILAKKEGAQIRGLHVTPTKPPENDPEIQHLLNEFQARCHEWQVPGDLAIETGKIGREICTRAHWADLIVLNLNHPPGNAPLERLGSGFRTIVRRCARPILAIPAEPTGLERVLLAYNNSPKAKEALYISAYCTNKWKAQLTVLTIAQENESALEIQAQAQDYLIAQGIAANYVIETGQEDIAATIVQIAETINCNLILMGGYKANPLVEVVLGSIVDEILRTAKCPMLICR